MTELLVAGVKPCVPQETLTLPGGVPMTFSFIPPGSFLAERSSTRPARGKKATAVQAAFYLGIHPVTQAQWRAVMGTNPSEFKGEELPVDSVSWENCQKFCRKLSKRVSRKVQLPTEAEWEHACRRVYHRLPLRGFG